MNRTTITVVTTILLLATIDSHAESKSNTLSEIASSISKGVKKIFKSDNVLSRKETEELLTADSFLCFDLSESGECITATIPKLFFSDRFSYLEFFLVDEKFVIALLLEDYWQGDRLCSRHPHVKTAYAPLLPVTNTAFFDLTAMKTNNELTKEINNFFYSAYGDAEVCGEYARSENNKSIIMHHLYLDGVMQDSSFSSTVHSLPRGKGTVRLYSE